MPVQQQPDEMKIIIALKFLRTTIKMKQRLSVGLPEKVKILLRTRLGLRILSMDAEHVVNHDVILLDRLDFQTESFIGFKSHF